MTILLVATVAATGLGLDAQRRGGRGRGTSTASPLVKHEVKNAKARQAICNDGSPLVYFFKAGRDADRRKWIIFFQGGEGCATDADCRTRWTSQHNLMTTEGQRPTEVPDGLLSDDPQANPDFASFTHVRVHYCSSDAFAGDTSHTIDGRTFEFRGHRGIDGLLDDLMDSSAVGSSTLRDATEVLVAGSSAGAMGVQNNLDHIAERLSWAKVKGVADSGWIPLVQKFGRGSMDVRPDAPEAFDYYHAKPDESCVAANPGQAGQCLLGSFEFKYITTPLFIYADQRDPSHLASLGISGGPRGNSEAQAYVQRYMALVRESLKDVPAAFSPILGAHMALLNERFQGAVIDGHTFAETLGAWYFGRPGPVKLIATGSGRRGR